MKPLEGKIAVVAGATRGAGRGIAIALGEAGATVSGGRGVHARVDHTVPEQVGAFFARVRDEHGGLDVLVNDVWGGDALTDWEKSPMDVVFPDWPCKP